MPLVQNEPSPSRIRTRSQLLFVAWQQAEDLAGRAERELAMARAAPAPDLVVTRARGLRSNAATLLEEMLGEMKRQVSDPASHPGL